MDSSGSGDCGAGVIGAAGVDIVFFSVVIVVFATTAISGD